MTQAMVGTICSAAVVITLIVCVTIFLLRGPR